MIFFKKHSTILFVVLLFLYGHVSNGQDIDDVEDNSLDDDIDEPEESVLTEENDETGEEDKDMGESNDGEEIEDYNIEDENEDTGDELEEDSFPDDDNDNTKRETSPEESEDDEQPDLTLNSNDREETEDSEKEKNTDEDENVGDICSLSKLDEFVDFLMNKINERIPNSYTIPDRKLRVMTISKISVSNLNTLLRYSPSAIACPGDGTAVLTVPMKSLSPIVGSWRWTLHFPRGFGGKVSVKVDELFVDAVIHFDETNGRNAKLNDLKVMRLEGISVKWSEMEGGTIGYLQDQLATLIVRNFKSAFRNFVQKELSSIIAKEMIDIPLQQIEPRKN